jgi:hypothetical protein
LCRKLQAAQRFMAQSPLPKQERTTTAVTQYLLGTPEQVSMTPGAYPQQTLGRQSPIDPSGDLWCVRRLEQSDAPRHSRKRRLQQSHLADASLV